MVEEEEEEAEDPDAETTPQEPDTKTEAELSEELAPLEHVLVQARVSSGVGAWPSGANSLRGSCSWITRTIRGKTPSRSNRNSKSESKIRRFPIPGKGETERTRQASGSGQSRVPQCQAEVSKKPQGNGTFSDKNPESKPNAADVAPSPPRSRARDKTRHVTQSWHSQK